MRKLFFIIGIVALLTTQIFADEGTTVWSRIWGSADSDSGNDVSVDNVGNVYVAGQTKGSFDGQSNNGDWDLCMSKYNSSGIKQWTRIWGSSTHDYGKGICVDNVGIVYVVGSTLGSFDGQSNNGDYDLCLSKYNGDGTKQWTRIWGSSDYDGASGVSVDNAGNIYVTGTTLGSFDGQSNNGSYDLCLTKYNSSGTKQWTRIWGSSDTEFGRGVSVDNNGSVYVVGSTSGSFDGQSNNGNSDLCMTKYNSNGIKQWTRIWGSYFFDYCNSVTVDFAENIYVAGQTDGSFDGQTNNGGTDLCLIKYNNNGTKEWTRIWGSAESDLGGSVAVDNTGNIYIVGYTDGSFDGQSNNGEFDLCLSKYNSNGIKQWSRIWGSSDTDFSSSVSVDNAADIYVAGQTVGSFDGQINPGGRSICLTRLLQRKPYGIITNISGANGLGSSNNPYNFGETILGNNDSATLRLSINENFAGNISISKISGSINFSASGLADIIFKDSYDDFTINYNAVGTQFVSETATFTITADNMDDLVFYVKAIPILTNAIIFEQWTRIWGSYELNTGEGVCVDNAGNIYVTGETGGAFDGQSNNGDYDLYLTKYSSNGTKQWTRIWGSADFDCGYGVSVDSAGNVYVAGITMGSFDGQSNNGEADFCLTKYNSDGTKQWTRIWGSADSDVGYGVSVDNAGNIYVAGFTEASFDGQINSGSRDLCLTKYNSSGTKQWTRIWGSTASDKGYGVSVDNTGNVYVTGYTGGSFDAQSNNGGFDLCLTKYNSSGTKQWTRIWGSSNIVESGNGVSVDGAGNIYVVGDTKKTYIDNEDLYLTKYDSNGSKQWTRIWGSSDDNYGNDVTTDNAGNIYVVGWTYSSFDGQPHPGFANFCLSKYNSEGIKYGSLIWGSADSDRGRGISVDNIGNIYVAGDTSGEFSGQSNPGGYSLCLTKFTQNIPYGIITNISGAIGSGSFNNPYDFNIITQNESKVATFSLTISGPEAKGIHFSQTGSDNFSLLGLSSIIYENSNDNFTINYLANGNSNTPDTATFNIFAEDMFDVVFHVKATTFNALPDKPSNQSPANGAPEMALTLLLQSSAFSDPNSGDIHTVSQWQISENSSFISTIYDSGETSVNKTSITVGTGILNYSTKYYWRVKHKDSQNNWSEYSDTTYFETKVEPQVSPNKPSNQSPANGAIEISLTPVLQSSGFSDSNSGDTHSASQWQIANNSSFSSVVYDSGETTASKTSLTVPSGELEEAMNYYWHIKHKDNNENWSDYSDETSFETLPEPFEFLILNFIFLIYCLKRKS